MNRRDFLFAGCAVSALGASSLNAHAGLPRPDELVKSAEIIKALDSKDVVLDRPGRVPRRRRRDPSISLQVQFTFDSAELLPQGKRQLDELAMALSDRLLSVSGFELAGHTDRVGGAQYNMELSLARANSVKDYLVEVHGISAARLQAIGRGHSQLFDPLHPTAATNRRVEVRRLRISPETRPDVESPLGGRLIPTPR